MKFLLALLVTPLLGSCSATHVIYVHESTVGIGLSASGAEGNTAFTFGYDSQTYSIIPRISPAVNSDGSVAGAPVVSRVDGDGTILTRAQGNEARADHEGPESMSLVAASQTYVEGVKRIVIHHALATGQPAIEVAKSASALIAIVAQTLVDSSAEVARARLEETK